ncbi:fasciclin domain-containing protein [bacterium]|nr:fasciclin domain-containing protein [bacterium]MDA7668677.1 fasciclin domain-containing protein [bacterium]MDB4632886.1 fasciclin domain-containing protein [bacterium]
MFLTALIASTTLLAPPCQSSCPMEMSETLAGARSSGPNDIVAVASSAGDFNTLIAAAKAAGLVGVLQSDGPLTVFAPTDAAFAKLPKGTVETLLKPENKKALVEILTYHVVPGKFEAADVLKKKTLDTANGERAKIAMKNGKPTIAGVNIVATDVEASNGVIHVIDGVMMPEQRDIVDVAVSTGKFKTLAAALGAADLVSTLKGKGPFTVLAPNDAAFAKLPAGTVEMLLLPENKGKLKEILLAHVVPGRVYSDQVVKLKMAPTAGGFKAPISVKDGKVSIGGANVIATDIEASNGVIHVIDTVIVPVIETD